MSGKKPVTQVPPPLRPPPQSSQPLQLPPQQLDKQRSWSFSSDLSREEAWLRHKTNNRRRRSKSSICITSDDVEELKGCMELGFGFDSPKLDRKLSGTFPALELYHAVNNKQYSDIISCKNSSGSSATASEANSPLGSPHPNPKENPKVVKERLKQWAQMVACSVDVSPRNSFKFEN